MNVPVWAALGSLVLAYCAGFLTPLALALALALIRKAVGGR